MFPSSVIRKLANSEEMLAETENFVGLAADVKGPIDIDLLEQAYDALLETRPYLTTRIERGPDGRHQLVADDLVPEGVEVVELDDPADEDPPLYFNQNEALVHLRVTIRDGQAQPTLYVHHALADGHHMYSLIEELLSYYTDLATSGKIRRGAVQPVPESIEAILADRGIQKGPRSGIERFMPAVFAYDLPPSRRAVTGDKPPFPVKVPMVSCRLDEKHTDSIVALCRKESIGLTAMVAAILLMAEWRIRGSAAIPIPLIYTVDLRYFLTPPVSATGCTNPIALTTFLADVDRKTDVVELARAIAETFKADLADGTIQQSRLHFSPQYSGNAPGLPDVVLLSDNGLVPPVRTPPGLEVLSTHGELYFAVSSGIEIYFTQIYAGQLNVEYHSFAPDPDKSVETIETLLREVAEKYA